MPEDEMITLVQAAEESGKKLQNLQRAASRGRLRVVKRGRDLWVSRKDLEAWLNDPQMHKPGPKKSTT